VLLAALSAPAVPAPSPGRALVPAATIAPAVPASPASSVSAPAPATLGAGTAPAVQDEAPAWRGAAPSGPLSAAERRQRRGRYLELALRQMRRLEQIEQRLDTQRLGAGALAAAAQAAAGAGAEAARWTGQLLEDCSGHWERVACARAELSLQRIVLRFPRALPPALLARARAEAGAAGPPPSPAEAASPWSFGDTENQRAVLIARSLGAAVVAASQDSANARAWDAYAAAFLAAHDRDGWYEAESPGYMAVSITALLQLADLAPAARVRDLARRELDLLLAAWAQQQVGGYPAGPRSRTYVQWALGDRTTPWRAWAWLAAATGDAAHLAFSDWPELALSDYEVPLPVAQLLRDRRSQPPYEIRARRHIDRGGRPGLDAALYSYATPDYILGVAQAVGGLRLEVAGGQEIVATLYPEDAEFAPLYLWSRSRNTSAERWKSWAAQDLAVGAGPAAVAYLGTGDPAPAGHAFLAAPWSRPEAVGKAGATVVSYCGDTYVALTTEGGWEVAPAAQRFPDYYGPGFADSWVAVPRRQPAAIGLQAGRRAESGAVRGVPPSRPGEVADFAAWRRRAAQARLGRAGDRLELTPDGHAGGGPAIAYLPGERATVGGAPLRPGAYPQLAAPFLRSAERGSWELSFGGVRRLFAALPADAW
jgi:hypothetical protein